VNLLKITTTLLMLVAFTLNGCGEGKDSSKKAPIKVLSDPNLVKTSPELESRLKLVRVVKVEMREIIRIPGSISVDEQRVARIGAAVTGRISDINVVLGQYVKKGDVLATLKSTELAQNQLVFMKARQQIQLQTKAVERAQLLLNADVIGSAELQRREVELAGAKAELNATSDQLHVLGMTDKAIAELEKSNNIRSVSSVTARLGGTIISRKVNLGQVVQPADELFIVADLSHVWAVAEVPERQAELIQKGQEVTVEIPAYGSKQISGKLIYVGETVNPQTRTITVRMDLNNSERLIKPEMLASMLVRSNPVLRLAIPMEAVVRENDQDYVFVQVAPNQYRLRSVKLGQTYDGMRAVLSDLVETDTIVSTGAFHLNSQRKVKELE
jgi:membrane fusion protein, heavy metal efflux system